MNISYFSQENEYECWVSVTKMVLGASGIQLPDTQLKDSLWVTRMFWTSLQSIVSCLNENGCSAKIQDFRIGDDLWWLHLPIIVLVNRFVYNQITPRIEGDVSWEDDEHSNHYVVVSSVGRDEVEIYDPIETIWVTSLSRNVFLESWLSAQWPGQYIACFWHWDD